ncbi:MAG: hypothetical protein ACR2MT_05190 [Aurantibacter sp.]
MMKARLFSAFFIFFLLGGFYSSAQNRVERQHRIKKSQFPSEALKTVAQNNKDIKRLKFYREVDTAQKRYIAKFKKARLFYEMGFDQKGEFKNMSFKVKQVDVPEDSFQRITAYLSQHFEKSKIRKMWQLYPIKGHGSPEKTIKKAFQNLMVPSMFYNLLVRGKKDGKTADYKVFFDAGGNFKEMRKSLPANYDRVLY